MYSILRGTDIDAEIDARSLNELQAPAEPIAYNPLVPPETFDFIVVDECHRSIFGVWRQVLEYFDAFIIGLSATPNQQALGFFDRNLVMEYNHDRAVADKVNVDYNVYRIQTKITAQGSKIESGLLTRTATERFRKFSYEKLLARDKVALDITWLQDESLEDSKNLPPPDILAAEIVDELAAALSEFRAVADMFEPSPEGSDGAVDVQYDTVT